MALKVWDGTAWTSASAIKVWNGTAWTSATAGKVWDGSAWQPFFSGAVQISEFTVLSQDNFGDGGFPGPNTNYEARSYVYFYANGHYQLVSGNYNSADAVVEDRIWLLSGTASDYGIKITSASGNPLTTGDADVVYQLNTTRYFSLILNAYLSGGGSAESNTFTAQIVSYPGGAPIVSASGTLSVEVGTP